jgi:serine/threonine-protein kinase
MPPANADRNLRFGMLALRMGFVGRDILLAALDAWMRDPGKSLGQLLSERGALTEEECDALDVLVEQHLAGPDATGSGLAPTLSDELRSPAHGDTPETGRMGPAAARRPLPAGGRYELLRPHARGGLGQVWVAADRELGREVALKEMHEQHARQPVSLSRFLLEARVTGGLEHPGIVPVYGLGRHPDGRPFYAMRFIQGDSLREAVEHFHRTGRARRPAGERALAFRQLLGRLVDVCDAVEYAHSRGVLHRDLKPANVMLGKYGETLVVDWGLAKLTGQAEGEAAAESAPGPSDTTLTSPGKVLGTPAYMSPEQAAGRTDQVGPRSDVYSLGATLYFLLTNRAPFPPGEGEDTLARVMRGEFAPPRQVKRDVPAALEAVCLKAMALKPEDRYPSPRALANDLEHWLAGEPVGAYREPWSGRTWRRLKRHRTAVLGAVAALAVAAVSLAVATALLSAKNEELTRANESEQAARADAQQNFELATQAVEDYLTGVANNARLREKDLEPLRRDLLRSARAFYERFARRKQDAPKYASLAARSNLALGRIDDLLGEWKQAETHFGQALAALRVLAEAEPGQYATRQGLVQAHLDLADLARRRKDFATAEPLARDALRLARQLGHDFPKETAPPKFEARGHRLLGNLLSDRERLSAAEEEYRRAVGVQGRLADDLWGQVALARDQIALGMLYNKMRRHADSHSAYREALRVLDGPARASPREPHVRSATGAAQGGLAEALLQGGQAGEAECWFSEALTTQERLAADFPMIPSYRGELAHALNDLSRFLWRQGRYEECVVVRRRWVAEAERLAGDFPDLAFVRVGLAQSYYGLGQAAEKVGDRDEGLRRRRKSVEVLRGVVKDVPDVPAYRMKLSIYLSGVGFTLASQRHYDEAITAADEAVRVSRDLTRAHPAVDEFQFRYAQCLLNHCAFRNAAGQGPVLEPTREAVGVLEAVAGRTGSLEHQSALGGAYYALAVHLRKGNPADARRLAGRAIEVEEGVLRRDPDLADAKRWLRQGHQLRLELLAGLGLDSEDVKDGTRAVSLAHTRRFEAALKEAEALAGRDDLSAAGHFNLARVYALLSVWKKGDAGPAEQYAARAVALLGEAHKSGYFAEAASAERLRQHPDLAGLRGRAEFNRWWEVGGGR